MAPSVSLLRAQAVLARGTRCFARLVASMGSTSELRTLMDDERMRVVMWEVRWCLLFSTRRETGLLQPRHNH